MSLYKASGLTNPLSNPSSISPSYPSSNPPSNPALVHNDTILNSYFYSKTVGNLANPNAKIDEDLDHALTTKHKFITQLCLECGKTWISLLSCSDKLCPECSIKRAQHHQNLLLSLLNILNPKDELLRFITLTIKNTKTLIDGYIKLRSCFSKLRARKLWKINVSGGFYSLEITKSSKGWHIHLHILYQGNYIPQEDLSSTWQKLTKDSFIVDIRECKNLSKVRKEICKYPLKPLDIPNLSDTDKKELNNFLHNKTLFVRFGSWRKVDLKPNAVRCPACGSTLISTLDFEPGDIRYKFAEIFNLDFYPSGGYAPG